MKFVYIKIKNHKYISGVIQETEESFITTKHHITFDKKTKEGRNNYSDTIFEYEELENEIEYIDSLKKLPLVSDYLYSSAIRSLISSIYYEDLCSDGKTCHLMLSNIIEKHLENIGVVDKFIIQENLEFYILELNKDKNFISLSNFSIERIPDIFSEEKK